MAIYVDAFFRDGLEVVSRRVTEVDATLGIANANQPICGDRTVLFFNRVADIETLVAALQQLGNDFAAAQPDAPERELPAEAYTVEIAKLDATATVMTEAEIQSALDFGRTVDQHIGAGA